MDPKDNGMKWCDMNPEQRAEAIEEIRHQAGITGSSKMGEYLLAAAQELESPTWE